MLSALDISTSGLVAERIRMNAISSNIANISTTHNEKGEAAPYQRKFVVFQSDENMGAAGAAGVRVSSVETDHAEPQLRFQPGHPDAIQQGPNKGNVAYPNISMMTEFTDAMEAARAYEANLGAIDITKNMEQQTLRIIA
ncbi:MAG: flagellar basal body rod protein FlgC [Thermoguttaceae bacterium]|jgi:flagellar basal-body rod protein FlgC